MLLQDVSLCFSWCNPLPHFPACVPVYLQCYDERCLTCNGDILTCTKCQRHYGLTAEAECTKV